MACTCAGTAPGYPQHEPGCGKPEPDIGPRDIWTVEVHIPSPTGGVWSEWSAWVDRATAEAEKAHAEDEGYQARIVRSS